MDEASRHEGQAAVRGGRGGMDGRQTKSCRTVEVPRNEAVVVLAVATTQLHQPVEFRPLSPHHAPHRGTNPLLGNQVEATIVTNLAAKNVEIIST